MSTLEKDKKGEKEKAQSSKSTPQSAISECFSSLLLHLVFKFTNASALLVWGGAEGQQQQQQHQHHIIHHHLATILGVNGLAHRLTNYAFPYASRQCKYACEWGVCVRWY